MFNVTQVFSTKVETQGNEKTFPTLTSKSLRGNKKKPFANMTLIYNRFYSFIVH